MEYNEFDMEMVEKIDREDELSEDDLKTIVFECDVIENIKGEEHRWVRDITTIVELCGRYFAVEWQRGLTENQESQFWKRPYEVEQYTYEKTITVTGWKRKEKI